MRKSLFLLTAWGYFLFPTLPNAETVFIRSGEHEDFSRLVMQFDEEIPSWTLGRSEEGYALRLKQMGLIIDTSETYKKINRARLADIHFDNSSNTLSLDVTCDCHINAFNFRDNKLVLDIKSGAAPENSPFEIPIQEQLTSLQGSDSSPAGNTFLPADTPPQIQLAKPILRLDNISSAPQPTEIVLHLPLTINNPPISRNLPPLELFADQNELALSSPKDIAQSPRHVMTTPPMISRSRESEDLLLRELARATSQGLLDAHLPDIPHPPPPNPISVISSSPQTDDTDQPDLQISGHFNIEADTSIDRSMVQSLMGVSVINETVTCNLGERLDIRLWGSPDNITAAITDARGALLDGRDSLDPEAVMALTRAYLYAGFGAEALQILDLNPVESDETKALRQIADLSDSAEQTSEGPLSALQNCSNAGAFWALLTESTIPAQGVNHDAIIEVATSLPPHLRSVFGSRLIRLYNKAGDISRAQILRASISRTIDEPHPEFRLAQAEMDHSAGETLNAEMVLTGIINENSFQSLEALTIFLQTALEQRTSIDPVIIGNAEALAFEYKGSDIGTRFHFLLARTYAQAQDFNRAIKTLDALDDTVSEFDLRFAWHELSNEILSLETDADFLVAIYQNKDILQSNSMEPQARRMIAGRLIQQGFDKTGREFLSVFTNQTADDRFLLAEAAFFAGDYQDALQLSTDLQMVEASLLRQRIYQKLQEYDLAILEFESRDPSEPATDLNWRQGNWDALSSGEQTLPQTTAAQIMLDQSEANTEIRPVRPSLSSGREILLRSQAEREVLETLLQNLPAPQETLSPDITG